MITTRAQKAADIENAKTKITPEPTAGTSTQMEAAPVPEHTEEENPLWDDQMHWSDMEEFGAPMIDDHWDVQMQTSDTEGDEEHEDRVQGTEDLWDSSDDGGGPAVNRGDQAERLDDTPSEKGSRKRDNNVGDPVTNKTHRRIHRGGTPGLCLETQYQMHKIQSVAADANHCGGPRNSKHV